jgi:hypothetical protein
MTRWDIAAGSVAPLWMLGYAGAMLHIRSKLARASFSSERKRELRYRRLGNGFLRAAQVGMGLTFVCFGSAYALRLLHQLAGVSTVLVYIAATRTLAITREYLAWPLKSRSSTFEFLVSGRLLALFGAVALSIGELLVVGMVWLLIWHSRNQSSRPVDLDTAARFGGYWLALLVLQIPFLYVVDSLFPCPVLTETKVEPMPSTPEAVPPPETVPPLPTRITSLPRGATRQLAEYLQPFGHLPPVVCVNANDSSYLPPEKPERATPNVVVAEPVLHTLEDAEVAAVIAATVLAQPAERPVERSPGRVCLNGLLAGIGVAAGLTAAFAAVTYLSLPLPLLLGAVAVVSLGIAGWTVYRWKLRLARQILADAVLARRLPEPDRLLTALRKLEHEERIRIERGRDDPSAGDAAYWREAAVRLSAHRRRANALQRHLSTSASRPPHRLEGAPPECSK